MNTASRLQGQARGGEIVMSDRLGQAAGGKQGESVQITVKGKAGAVSARRIAA